MCFIIYKITHVFECIIDRSMNWAELEVPFTCFLSTVLLFIYLFFWWMCVCCLQNAGPLYEWVGAGLTSVKIEGLNNGTLDLSGHPWTYKVFLFVLTLSLHPWTILFQSMLISFQVSSKTILNNLVLFFLWPRLCWLVFGFC